MEAVEAGKPVVLLFGQVISASPLKIQVDQKTILTEKMLILTRNVTDFEVDMSVSHITENRAGGSGDPAFASHNHDYKGRKKFKVHNALVKGDEVVLAGFGTFSVAERAPRKARNLHTNEEIEIPAKKVPKFKAGKFLKDAVE
nr:HU family DNA-binding protein [Turicimonas muris]